jgi:hypothetical protein
MLYFGALHFHLQIDQAAATNIIGALHLCTSGWKQKKQSNIRPERKVFDPEAPSGGGNICRKTPR